jgi:hypothetical protein
MFQRANRLRRRKQRLRALQIVATLGVGGLAIGAGLTGANTASAVTADLVLNGGFETGTTGWNSPSSALARVTGGHSGSYAARLTPTGTATTVLNDTPNTVTSSQAGRTYVVSAWVRALAAPTTLQLRLREVLSGVQVKQTIAKQDLTDTTWHQVTLSHVAASSGSTLDVNVFAPLATLTASFKGFDVDDVSVALQSDCSVNSKLVPSCGVLWGGYIKPGAVAGTTDWYTSYTGMESKVGRNFDIVKRYHDFSNAGNSGVFPDAAEQALAAGGRIPHFAWVSKNYSTGAVAKWADIAAGKYDATVVNPVGSRLKNYGGKVFLDFDHEMDGVTRTANGTAAEYVAAYRHIYARFAAIGATNVVWVWVPTGYLGNATKIAASYPGDAYVDWIGYDPYNFFVCHSTTWRDYETVISGFYNWLIAQGHGNKPFMLAEYGSVAGSDVNARANWFRGQVTALKKYPNIKAIQLFNSSDGGSCNAEISADAPALTAWGDMGRDPLFKVAH